MMRILRNGVLFSEGYDLLFIASAAGEDVSLYSFHPDDYRAHKLAEIKAACEAELSALKAEYPESEVLSWDKQEKEARDCEDDAQAATPLLDALAASRGLAKTELASRIIAKADAFASAAGHILGTRQRLEDDLKAMSDWSEMQTVSWPQE